MLKRVAAASIFGKSGIAVICITLIVEHDIFDDGATANRIPDDGLILAAEIDGFRIAAPFYIKDGTFGPAVFIVANEITVRICR